MPRIYKLSRAGLRLLYKVRHHRGHGIHSPFVYNLITKVIEEKKPYYKYLDIKEYINSKPYIKGRITKYNLLTFRLCNYFNVKKVLEIGSGEGLNTLYLTAANKNIECICIETSLDKAASAKILYKDWSEKISLHVNQDLSLIQEKQDCVYINLKNYTFFSADSLKSFIKKIASNETFIIVNGIRTNKKNQMLWKSMDDIEGRTAKLDLFHLGILFFDNKLYKWNYQISF